MHREGGPAPLHRLDPALKNPQDHGNRGLVCTLKEKSSEPEVTDTQVSCSTCWPRTDLWPHRSRG